MKNRILKSLAYLFLSIFLIGTISAHSATMYIASSEKSYEIKETFSLGIYLSSTEQAANAISAAISFPDTIEITSISKTNLISFWIKEPSFSNTEGLITFEGVVFNPGFIGNKGEIFTMDIKPKNEGSAYLNFLSGYVLANDGKGTDITTELIGATFEIEKVEILREKPAKDTVEIEVIPKEPTEEPTIEPVEEPIPTKPLEEEVQPESPDSTYIPAQPEIPELTKPEIPSEEITKTKITLDPEEILAPTEIPKVEIEKETTTSKLFIYASIIITLFLTTIFISTFILFKRKQKNKH